MSNTITTDIRTELNNWEDILKFHGLTPKQFKEQTKSLKPYQIGYEKEILIVAAYNQNQKPDWDDKTRKYYPWFQLSGGRFVYCRYGRWSAASPVGSRQVFVGPQAYDNMRDAVEKFLPQYKESRTL